jgi:hypothetical protein
MVLRAGKNKVVSIGMKNFLFSLMFITIGSISSAQVRTRIILPADTDPAIDGFSSSVFSHYVYLGESSKKRNQLLVFLTGTGGPGGTAKEFNETAARLGYHVINLIYPDTISMAFICKRNPDKECFDNARKESVVGGDFIQGLEISKANGIENRLLKLILYLKKKFPLENWEQFLKSEKINWKKIVVSGQSQGGGHAAYIAKTHKVSRVLMFASPKDYGIVYNSPANWILTKSKTPSSRYFAFAHGSDSLGCTFSQQLEIFKEMKLYRFGEIVNVDNIAAPFYHTHILTSTRVIKTTTAHSSVIVLPEFEFVWRYMLTQ